MGASLGLTPAEIAAVQDTATVMAFYADARAAAEAYVKAVKKHINDIRELAVGEPTPAWPAAPVLALPEVIATGINQRLNELENRIIASANYTNEIGALLGDIARFAGTDPGKRAEADDRCL